MGSTKSPSVTKQYICDSTALIDLREHFPKNFSTKLRKLVADGKLLITDGVLREIRKKDDKLRKTLDRWSKKYHEFIISFSSKSATRLKEEYAELERKYGESIIIGNKKHDGFWKSASGRRAADAQVVAAGKLLRAVVVSDDRAVKLACLLEGVECITWTEFARILGFIKPSLPDLFDSNATSGR